MVKPNIVKLEASLKFSSLKEKLVVEVECQTLKLK